MLPLKLGILALSFFVAHYTPAYADGSSVGGGGGTSCGGIFLDNLLRKNKYDPRKDPSFQKYVRPALQKVRACLPSLASDMEMILTKPWFTVDCKLKVSTSSQVYYDVDQLAYQDRNGVFIDRNLLDRLRSETALENRGDLIWHELLQGLRIEKYLRNQEKFDVEETAIGVLSGKLRDLPAGECTRMQAYVMKYLRNAYPTTAQLGAWGIKLGLAATRAACQKKDYGALDPPGSGYYWDRAALQAYLSGTDTKNRPQAERILATPMSEAAMKKDAELRLKAKLLIDYDGEGFYSIPVVAKTSEQVCQDLLQREVPRPAWDGGEAEVSEDQPSGNTSGL